MPHSVTHFVGHVLLGVGELEKKLVGWCCVQEKSKVKGRKKFFGDSRDNPMKAKASRQPTVFLPIYKQGVTGQPEVDAIQDPNLF